MLIADLPNPVRVIDLGSGTGSNLRALAPKLAAVQHWLLVDYDPVLIAAAQEELSRWADTADRHGMGEHTVLTLTKEGKKLTVRWQQADLNTDLAAVLDAQLAGAKADLITAAALFDLISPAWIARFAAQVGARNQRFYTTLTYNGDDSFAPPHALDAAIIGAFASHQGSDKGFGPAAGPKASAALAQAFEKAGYRVQSGDSPWILGEADQALVHELLAGMANAVAETGLIAPEKLHAWRAFRQQAAATPQARLLTGHTDLLALPR